MDVRDRAVASDALIAFPHDCACLEDRVGLWLRLAHRRYLDEANRRFERYKLNHVEFLALTVISRSPGCRLILLAQQLRLQPPNLAGVVDELTARCLITKTEDPVDRRANQLTLTDSGARLLDQLELEHEQLKRDIEARVGPGWSEQLAHTLQEISRLVVRPGRAPR
jgi:DNA-binding MarR family transcriptional regulator